MHQEFGSWALYTYLSHFILSTPWWDRYCHLHCNYVIQLYHKMLRIHAQSLYNISIIKLQLWICGKFNKYLLNENMKVLIGNYLSAAFSSRRPCGKRGAILWAELVWEMASLDLDSVLSFLLFPRMINSQNCSGIFNISSIKRLCEIRQKYRLWRNVTDPLLVG